MTPETPLTEVAAHLPREGAAHLCNYDSNVQVAVLVQIRALMVFWEAQRCEFDAIAYEGLLNGLVAHLAPMFAEAQRLRVENAILARRLEQVDLVIRNLGRSTAQAPQTELHTETESSTGGEG